MKIPIFILTMAVLALFYGEPPKGQLQKASYLPWEGWPSQWRRSE